MLSIATANAFISYLDRICMGAVVQSTSFQQELGLGRTALAMCSPRSFSLTRSGNCQRAGSPIASAREGCWSRTFCCGRCSPGLTGFVGGLLGLIVVRSACGLAEAGAYPASALLITRWFPFTQRARANSVVSLGGRMGNSLALWLTAGAIAFLGSWRPVLWIYGAIGLGLALATYIIFRDSPSQHPWTNESERELIQAGAPPVQPLTSEIAMDRAAPASRLVVSQPWNRRHEYRLGVSDHMAADISSRGAWPRSGDGERLCIDRARLQSGRNGLRRLVVRLTDAASWPAPGAQSPIPVRWRSLPPERICCARISTARWR